MKGGSPMESLDLQTANRVIVDADWSTWSGIQFHCLSKLPIALNLILEILRLLRVT